MDINRKQVKRLPLIQIKDIAREVRPKSGLGYLFMSGTREIMNVRVRGIHLIISIVIRPEKINIFKHHNFNSSIHPSPKDAAISFLSSEGVLTAQFIS